MAIRRSLITQRIRCVWSKDPALDTSNGFPQKWEEYEKTANPEVLPLKQGEKLTVFDCRPLTREDWLRTTGLAGREFADSVIAYSLEDVENYEGPDGRAIKIEKDSHQRDGNSRHLKREVLDQLYDPSIWDEVAAMILRHSRLDPTRGPA